MFLLGTSVVQDQISGIDTAIKEEWEWNAQANKGPAKYWTCINIPFPNEVLANKGTKGPRKLKLTISVVSGEGFMFSPVP